MKKFEELARKIGSLVDEKNTAYGNSFEQAGDFLRLLYPNGIPPESYSDMLCVVRIFDKLKRIATNKGAFSESPYQDIVGYGLLGVDKDLRAAKENSQSPSEDYEEVSQAEVSPVPSPEPEMIDMKCQLCGGFVGQVASGSSESKLPYVHESCWKGRIAAMEKTTPADPLLPKITSP